MGILSGTKKSRGIKITAEDRKRARAIMASIAGKLDTKVSFQSANPKRLGSDTYDRWQQYSKARTLKEYSELNDEEYQDADLLYALERKQVTIG